jgi:hypothetical protein
MNGDEKIISTHASIARIGSIGTGPPKAASGVAGERIRQFPSPSITVHHW